MKKILQKILGTIICSLGFTTFAGAMQEPPHAQEILEYWFGSINSVEDYPHDKAPIWFQGGEAIDNEIRNRFKPLVIAAAAQELESWKETPRGRLALIVLLDQFTRNIFRGTAQAFACDQIAQQLTLEGLAQGDDQALLPIERVFFYFPLEHAEDMELQKLSIEKFHSILPFVPQDQVPYFISFADYAKKHFDVIAQFGRFPHRNAILGRESTPEELEFLKNPH